MYLEKEAFFEAMGRQGQSLGFENLIIASGPSQQVVDCIESGDFDVEFVEPDLSAPYTRNSRNKLPLVSAAMDTVTESKTAIIMPEAGGRGVIHAGLDPEAQFKELEKVKKRLQGFIEQPKKLKDDMSFEQVHNICSKYDFTTFPVTDSDGRLVGMVTNHQIKRSHPDDMVVDKMVPLNELTVVTNPIDIREAHKIMLDKNINTLPIVDENDVVTGMFLFSDTQRIVEENSGMRNVDGKGRYVCDIAVPTDDAALDRVELCYEYLADGGGVVTLDTAQGDGLFAFKILKKLKEEFSGIDLMVGNVTNPESAVLLARMGADGVKIGQASGGVCTTNQVTGIGRGQITSTWECVRALDAAGFGDVPVCSDGGVKNEGDPAKAIVVGALSVMIGSRFGATDEAPGEKIQLDDGTWWKVVRGMGSPDALKVSAAARHRYGDGKKMPLAEGRSDLLPFQGPLGPIVNDFRMALRKSLIYAGAVDIESFQRNTAVEFDARRKR